MLSLFQHHSHGNGNGLQQGQSSENASDNGLSPASGDTIEPQDLSVRPKNKDNIENGDNSLGFQCYNLTGNADMALNANTQAQSTIQKSLMDQLTNGGGNMNGHNFHDLLGIGSTNNYGAMDLAIPANPTQDNGQNSDAKCQICNKEFYNKFFLETHKAKAHGIHQDPSMMQSAPDSSNGNHHSSEPSPKTPPTQHSNLTNPMTFPFPMPMDQQNPMSTNICPFCYQFFPNAMVLQNHVVTSHSGLLMNPAAAVYMASLMSTNPLGQSAFLQQPMTNGKNNQQPQQQQLAAIAAAAAMLGFGQMPTNDQMIGMQPNLETLMQGRQPNLESMQPNLETLMQSMQGMQPNLETLMGGMQQIPQSSPAPLVGHQRLAPSTSVESILTTAYMNGFGQKTPSKNYEAYCDICQKEFCNKYFLKTHRLNKHGILDESPRANGGMKRMANNSPVARLPYPNGREEDEKNLQADENGPPPKMAKLEETAESSSNQATTSGQFQCNLCVKAFPSMFALVAHKYRDHATFDGTAASILTGDQSNDSLSPASFSAQQRLQPRKSLDTDFSLLSSGKSQNIDLEAFCEICQKEFCSKYFLKVHKANIHGIGNENVNGSPVNGNGTPLNLSGILANDSTVGLNLSVKADKENGRRHSTNGTPTMASLLMMAATGVSPGSIAVGRQLVASKNFCDICNKELCNKYFLRTHMLKMHGIVIDENKTIIANINTLDKEKNGELLFRCDLCGEQLASRHQLRAHKQSVHQIVVPASSFTPSPNLGMVKSENGTAHDGSSNSGSDQMDHPIEMQPAQEQGTPKNVAVEISKSVLCSMCGKRFKNARCLRIHILNDHVGIGQKAEMKKSALMCEYCSKEFLDHEELQMHVISQHHNEVRGSVATMAEQAALDSLTNSNAFVAAVNSVVNAVAEAAAGSETNSTPGMDAKPEVDQDVKDTQAQSREHADLPLVTRATNGTKLFRCSYCNYYTKWISNLSTHEKRHNIGKPRDSDNGDKPFQCRMCLRSYRYSHSLQRHMEVHKSAALALRDRYAMNGHRLSTNCPPTAQIGQMNDTHSKTPPALNTPQPLDQTDQSIIDQNDQSIIDQVDQSDQSIMDENQVKTAITNGSPSKLHHCETCGKAFGNHELYRLHVFTMHNAISTNGNPTKRVYRCRMCHFSTTKSFDDLRMHTIQKHSKSPEKRRMPLITGDGDKNDIPLETPKMNGDMTSASRFGDMTSASRFGDMTSASRFGDMTSASRFGDMTSAFGDMTSRFGYMVQPFLMKAINGLDVFPNSSVIYLPVLRKVESPMEATFTLTPINDDQPLENGKHD